jgi:[ribosomal protein S5]-alanine N-acetyltransferase
MEKMPYQSHLEPTLPLSMLQTPAVVTNDWRTGLPCLKGARVSLREMRASDAPALFAALSSEQVSKFISPPPATIDGFGRFINWAIRQRQAGQYVCFAVVPHGSDTAIGIFQVRSLEPAFGTAEWGFALASEFWGQGFFTDGAKLVINFAFEVLGVHRLEARAAVKNGRGNGALRKLGAVQEGVLRRSFLRNGEYLDQALWTILQDEWIQAKTVWGSHIIH